MDLPPLREASLGFRVRCRDPVMYNKVDFFLGSKCVLVSGAGGQRHEVAQISARRVYCTSCRGGT